MLRLALLALSFGSLAVGKPLISKRWDDFEVKHAWAEIPAGWNFYAPAPADHIIDMRIALTQDKFDELVKQLFEVSDPYHAK